MLDASPRVGSSPASPQFAVAMLMLATAFWGCGFTWAKAGGEAIQRASGLPSASAFGPIFLLAWRFLIAGFVWVAVFPSARAGWTLGGAARSLGVGLLLCGSIIVQHLGLDRTSEATSAFLTSLTILFVPLLMTFALGRPPRAPLWLGVGLASVGVWRMTGASAGGFGRGELLGLACALGFSVYILAVNAASARQTPWRMTAGQFFVTAAGCFGAAALVPGGASRLAPTAMFHILRDPQVLKDVLLMALFPTLAAFGLLTHFQPRLDPTRAALIYLLEPVIATAYASAAARHYPDRGAIIGAAMIVCANAMVEVLSSRQAKDKRVVLME